MRTPRPTDLAAVVSGPGVEIASSAPDLLDIVGLPAARIGDLAAERGIPLHELTPTTGSLEDAYLALTGDSVEYRTKEIS
ncbi:hypothetical protein D3C81_2249850 [compost metagenome]